jgi:hypothetical protein
MVARRLLAAGTGPTHDQAAARGFSLQAFASTQGTTP